jgi:hypothetical protein
MLINFQLFELAHLLQTLLLIQQFNGSKLMELIGVVVESGTVEIYFIWAVLITTVGVLLFLISMAM